MAGSIIAGFAPAASDAAKGVTGLTAAAGEAADPLGLFGALVNMLDFSNTAGVAYSRPTDVPRQAVTTGLAALRTPLDVGFAAEAPSLPRTEGTGWTGELVAALADLETALAAGEPVTPERAERLSDAIGALAGLLGVPLPADHPVAPPAAGTAPPEPHAPARTGDAAPAAASPALDAAIDALLELAARAAPVLKSAGTPALPPAGESDGAVVPPAPAAATLPQGPVPAAPAATPAPAETASAASPVQAPAAALAAATETPPPAPAAAADLAPAADPASPLGRLVETMTRLARSLEPQVPGLARRLDALAEKLGSGDAGARLLAGLGIDAGASPGADELEQAIARLLRANPDVKGAPAPQAFAAAELDLPEVVAPPSRPAASAAPVSETAGGPQRPAPEFRAPASDESGPQPGLRAAVTEPQPAAARAEAAEPVPTPPAPQAVAPSVLAGAKAVHAAYQAPVHQINIPQVAFEVVRHFQAGNTRFQIRLDPPELGRIDVRLDVDQGGNVNARMTVERAETLDLMQRDQRALERALAQAGLDGAKTNLEFSLRQNQSGREDGGDGRPGGASHGSAADDEAAGRNEEVPAQALAIYRGAAGARGLNLFV